MSRVLVAEDDSEISTLISLTLRMEGYDVLQARDGAQALALVREERPDLVLLDVMMPHLSGYEVARQLQDDPNTVTIPIIFVTAKHEMEDRVLGLSMSVDYICKPFAVPELLARVRAALRMRKLQEELRISNERLSRLAVTDELTGLANRRGFEQELEDEILRARRFGQPIAVTMLDLDRFKLINDTWGHARGDVVLQAFARVLQSTSRRVDKVARIGGEEFVALLPTTDAVGAETFAEKVRAATEALEIPGTHLDGTAAPPLRVTTSAGVAVATHIPDIDASNASIANALLQQADACLYAAKDAGRNRVVMRVIDNITELPLDSTSGPIGD
ncbi:MAG: two-component system, cell cycle response regulator [Abditibacteriota bacterium]|nr:two-component system, cell cycle response regulator [Abditibacteriota bacterium]